MISVYLQKGGTGKTSLVSTLGQTLAYMGYKVLVVDMEGQCDLSKNLLKYEGDYKKFVRKEYPNVRRTVQQMLAPGRDRNRRVVPKATGRGDKIATYLIEMDPKHVNTGGELRLVAGEPTAATCDDPLDLILGSTDRRLKDAVDHLDEAQCIVGEFYHTIQRTATGMDFVIIDLQPNLTSLHRYALFSSHYILAPPCAELESLDKAKHLGDSLRIWLEEFKTHIWPKVTRAPKNKWPQIHPKLLGFVLTIRKRHPGGDGYSNGALLAGWGEKERAWITDMQGAFAKVRERLCQDGLALDDSHYKLGPEIKKLHLTSCLGVVPDYEGLQELAKQLQTTVPFLPEPHKVERLEILWLQIAWNVLQLIKSSHGNGARLPSRLAALSSFLPPASAGLCFPAAQEDHRELVSLKEERWAQEAAAAQAAMQEERKALEERAAASEEIARQAQDSADKARAAAEEEVRLVQARAAQEVKDAKEKVEEVQEKRRAAEAAAQRAKREKKGDLAAAKTALRQAQADAKAARAAAAAASAAAAALDKEVRLLRAQAKKRPAAAGPGQLQRPAAATSKRPASSTPTELRKRPAAALSATSKKSRKST